MILTKHVINPNRVANSSDLISGPYPISLSLDKFLDLFADVKSLSANGISIIDNTLTQNFTSSDIGGTLNNLENFDDTTDISSFAGTSRRKIIPIGQLNPDGSEPSLSHTPTTLVDYPSHTIGTSGGSVTINLGRTLMAADLFYPYILVQFSTGMGNLAGGLLVGGINFSNYGVIPIFGGPRVDGITQGFAEGSININERYSSLRASATLADIGGTITFTSQSNLQYLQSYTSAFFGPIKTDVEANNNQLIVTVPKYAKSGPVRFNSTDPHFDSFLSYDEIRVK